jgi:hypothetical protein
MGSKGRNQPGFVPCDTIDVIRPPLDIPVSMGELPRSRKSYHERDLKLANRHVPKIIAPA